MQKIPALRRSCVKWIKLSLEMVGQHAAADGGLRFGANVAGIGLFAIGKQSDRGYLKISGSLCWFRNGWYWVVKEQG